VKRVSVKAGKSSARPTISQDGRFITKMLPVPVVVPATRSVASARRFRATLTRGRRRQPADRPGRRGGPRQPAVHECRRPVVAFLAGFCNLVPNDNYFNTSLDDTFVRDYR